MSVGRYAVEKAAMSRLWPRKPDGSLDYGRLTVREIGEDLEESLMDCVENAGQHELEPFLVEYPDLDSLPASDPPRALVETMEELLRLEREDAHFRSPGTRELVRSAVRQLKLIAGGVA